MSDEVEFIETEDNRPFEPRGKAIDLLYGRESEILMSGPAGTGKSRACLEKLYACAIKYPGMRGLIIRKTRESLTETGLVTWEDKVVPKGDSILNGPSRNLRADYEFENGSKIIVGGLGKAQHTQKVMSSEYDMVFVQEATELSVQDWEQLTTRTRNGVMPYQQLIADCNPGPPKHWLKQRCDIGSTRLIESRHEDNPRMWDAKENKWTEFGEKYIAILDKLTGARKLRLRYGKWAQAEGVVYEEFDSAIHIVDRFSIPQSWTRYLSIDFGYTNPFVAAWWAMDPDGRLFRYREIYHTRRTVKDHAAVIKARSKDEPRPSMVVCDHDAEDRATFEQETGWKTVPAIKEKSPRFQAVKERLKKADDGKARLFFLRDSLVERDAKLTELAKPCCTEEEFDGYVWDTRAGQKKGDQPIDADNHGMDQMGYLVMTLAGKPKGRWSDVSTSGSTGQRSIVDEMPEGIFGAV